MCLENDEEFTHRSEIVIKRECIYVHYSELKHDIELKAKEI